MNARPDATNNSSEISLPAELRSALELAQAAVWDWRVLSDQFAVDEAWCRAFGVEHATPVHLNGVQKVRLVEPVKAKVVKKAPAKRAPTKKAAKKKARATVSAASRRRR